MVDQRVGSMAKDTILIIVDYLNFLRNDLYICSSLNVDTIRSILNKDGYPVEIKSWQQILNAEEKPTGRIIWYASSDFLSYKDYIEDVLLYLKDDNILIPPFDIFRAHNNKGYQHILRRKLALPALEENYFGTYEELAEIIDSRSFPTVLKKTGGSGSINVRLVRSRDELRRVVKKLSRKKTFVSDLIKRYLKRYIFKHKYSYDNSRESMYYGNFILQEFIPGLQNDWKVLVFFDKYFVFERLVRSNDFRASGSGKFFYREFDLDMLDYCKNIFDKLQTPWLSLDICFDGKSYHLLEFQGINFGPIGLKNGPYYFIQDSAKNWQKINEKYDLSKAYAESVLQYIKRFHV